MQADLELLTAGIRELDGFGVDRLEACPLAKHLTCRPFAGKHRHVRRRATRLDHICSVRCGGSGHYAHTLSVLGDDSLNSHRCGGGTLHAAAHRCDDCLWCI